MSEQRMPFPPRGPFPPRAPFHRGRGRPPHPRSRNPGWRSPAPDNYHDRGTPSPVNIHSVRPPNSKHSQPRSSVPVQKNIQSVPVPTPYSCGELLEALRSIQQVVQCCSCHKILHSVRTCATGHGLCWNCKNRCNKICPVCNTLVADSKPIMLNNVVKLLPRMCNYNEKGCDGLILASDMNHETFCRFRNVTCRIPSCEVKCMAKDLLRHLEDFHGQELIRCGSHSQILMNFNAKISKNGLAVIVAYNNIIWQHTRIGNNCLLQFYQYVPMEKPKAKFSAVVNFHTPEISFTGKTPVHTDVFDPVQLFKDKETFCLPRKVAISLSKFYGGVNYDFKIIEEEL